MSAAPLLFDLADRGTVVLTGKDRATFLHGLVTNDVKKLSPGQGCAAAFLTAKGRMLAECVVLCEAERLVLDTPPALSATVESLLRTYLVFNDVTITNETEDTHVFYLTEETDGDGAEDFLRRVIGPGAAAPTPREAHAHAPAVFTFKEISSPSSSLVLVRENRTGIAGWDLRVPSSLSKEIFSSLQSSGARLSTNDEFERRRIAAGIPLWGAEMTEAVLPDEAGLRERGFIADNKGCYVGQEIVARIKTYGHVNRKLVRLAVSGGVPRPGEEVFFEGEKAGSLTSVAPASGGGAAALAYVKRERSEVGTALTIASFAGGLSASVAPVAPVPLA
ncbi:MAG TPA: glycine cleavage T C-terminal barrel domain-containing protein [Thermoanaerobaculia bacterium]